MFKPGVKIDFAFVYIVCAILSLAVYSRAFDNPFHDDDLTFLDYSERTSFPNVFKSSHDFSFYRPGTLALFCLEHKLFARNSGAYIEFNYILHVAISLLMLSVLSVISPDRKIAFLASGLFLVGFGHYGKQLMWACTSGPLMSVVLSLASIRMALQALRLRTDYALAKRKQSHTLYASVALFLLILSPLFHEASLLTPIVVAFVAVVYLRTSCASKLKHVAFFLLPLPLWILVLSVISKSYPAYSQFGEVILDAPLYLIRYMGFMVVPLQRSHLVEPSPILDIAIEIGKYLHIVIGSTLLLLLLYLLLRARAGPSVLSAWLLLGLAPFTLVPMPDSWLDLRYLYYASIPFCGLTATAVLTLAARTRAYWRAIVVVAVVAAMSGSMLLTLLLERRYDQYG